MAQTQTNRAAEGEWPGKALKAGDHIHAEASRVTKGAGTRGVLSRQDVGAESRKAGELGASRFLSNRENTEQDLPRQQQGQSQQSQCWQNSEHERKQQPTARGAGRHNAHKHSCRAAGQQGSLKVEAKAKAAKPGTQAC